MCYLFFLPLLIGSAIVIKVIGYKIMRNELARRKKSFQDLILLLNSHALSLPDDNDAVVRVLVISYDGINHSKDFDELHYEVASHHIFSLTHYYSIFAKAQKVRELENDPKMNWISEIYLSLGFKNCA